MLNVAHEVCTTKTSHLPDAPEDVLMIRISFHCFSRTDPVYRYVQWAHLKASWALLSVCWKRVPSTCSMRMRFICFWTLSMCLTIRVLMCSTRDRLPATYGSSARDCIRRCRFTCFWNVFKASFAHCSESLKNRESWIQRTNAPQICSS